MHSVAVQPGDPVAYTHRPLPKNQRVGGDHNWTGDTYLTSEHLDEVDTRIVGLIEPLMSVRPRAERVQRLPLVMGDPKERGVRGRQGSIMVIKK